ncbi:MAG: class I SAM-dependent methyltransferase [Candidatus Hodarchaeales archaeon]|jgi:ubiquinone/menaquinone biosynthesis C-methylase UbiE
MKEKERKEELSGMFTRAASTYDRVGTRFFSYFGKRLVELIGIPEKTMILDVATGRGASLFPAAKKVGSEGSVIGIDLAHGMVKETNSDLTRIGLSNAQVILMDAEDLNFDDNTFNIVLCGLAIFFFPHYKEALSEALRVLKPGGKIGISTFSRSEDQKYNIQFDWFWEVVERVLPPSKEEKKGKKVPEKSNGPEFDTPEGMLKILTTAGFRDVYTVHEENVFVSRDVEEFWKEAWSHGFRATLEKIPSENLDKVKEEVGKSFAKHRQAEGLDWSVKVLFTFGTK